MYEKFDTLKSIDSTSTCVFSNYHFSTIKYSCRFPLSHMVGIVENISFYCHLPPFYYKNHYIVGPVQMGCASKQSLYFSSNEILVHIFCWFSFNEQKTLLFDSKYTNEYTNWINYTHLCLSLDIRELFVVRHLAATVLPLFINILYTIKIEKCITNVNFFYSSP